MELEKDLDLYPKSDNKATIDSVPNSLHFSPSVIEHSEPNSRAPSAAPLDTGKSPQDGLTDHCVDPALGPSESSIQKDAASVNNGSSASSSSVVLNPGTMSEEDMEAAATGRNIVESIFNEVESQSTHNLQDHRAPGTLDGTTDTYARTKNIRFSTLDSERREGRILVGPPKFSIMHRHDSVKSSASKRPLACDGCYLSKTPCQPFRDSGSKRCWNCQRNGQRCYFDGTDIAPGEPVSGVLRSCDSCRIQKQICGITERLEDGRCQACPICLMVGCSCPESEKAAALKAPKGSSTLRINDDSILSKHLRDATRGCPTGFRPVYDPLTLVPTIRSDVAIRWTGSGSNSILSLEDDLVDIDLEKGRKGQKGAVKKVHARRTCSEKIWFLVKCLVLLVGSVVLVLGVVGGLVYIFRLG
ncbi:hypothetical protein BJ508DRAFT_414387 [Ascobolus immersus RN42]|uniref:Zn(2)-C6 fungal-type domain-containing protein n=1 Tax=Ascobolus immersus RN42 TaxID=1160509 RepID=A0A3N4I741_ASCIM|nr:hypothetical protein BJ508DRAFT_414387 [Ascobolus immersus RN42]